MQTPVRPLDLAKDRDHAFQAEVESESGQTLASCYQCGNCTAGCAYTPDYDFPVHQVMRLVQLGLRQQALTCRSIWLCATCQACTTRKLTSASRSAANRCCPGASQSICCTINRLFAATRAYLPDKMIPSRVPFIALYYSHGMAGVPPEKWFFGSSFKDKCCCQ